MLKRNNFFQLRHFITVFVYIILIFSCNQKESEKVCKLTSDQIPEIRGLHLGMTQEQIEQKYPNLFSRNVSLSNNQSEEFDLSDYEDMNTKVLYVSSTISEPLSNKFSDLKDISAIVLILVDERLSAISIKYLSSTDNDFPRVFKDKTSSFLGIISFTNWQNSGGAINKLKSYQDYYGILRDDRLLCNQVEILLRMITIKAKNKEFPDTHHPILTIKMTNQIALTESEEKQAKEEKKQEEQKKNKEEKRKTETFNP